MDSNTFNRKVLISSVAMLLLACLIILFFHLFARRFRRRHLRHLNTAATVTTSHGLDLNSINSLPTFIYGSKNQESLLECAVCLSEFEDDEPGRTLPDCNHCFHVDCIDMWLQSHCDCPLCRARVKPSQSIEDQVDPMVSVNVAVDTGFGSGSELHAMCPLLWD